MFRFHKLRNVGCIPKSLALLNYLKSLCFLNVGKFGNLHPLLFGPNL